MDESGSHLLSSLASRLSRSYVSSASLTTKESGLGTMGTMGTKKSEQGNHMYYLKQGACVGLKNSNKNKHKLEIWESNVSASIDCTVLQLTTKCIQRLMVESDLLEMVINEIYQRADFTYKEITYKRIRYIETIFGLDVTTKTEQKKTCLQKWLKERHIINPRSSQLHLLISIITTVQFMALAIGDLLLFQSLFAVYETLVDFPIPEGSEMVLLVEFLFALAWVLHLTRIGLRMHTGFRDSTTGFINMDPIMVIKSQKRFTLVLYDVFSLLPSPFVVAYLKDTLIKIATTRGDFVYILLITLLLIPVYLQFISIFSWHLGKNSENPFSQKLTKIKHIITIFLVLAFTIATSATIWYYVTCNFKNKDNCKYGWVYHLVQENKPKTLENIYFSELYAIITIATATGFGDIVGYTNNERVYLIVVMITFYLASAYLQAIITSKIQTLAQNNIATQRRQREIKSALVKHDISKETLDYILIYLEKESLRSEGKHIESFYSSLHPSLLKDLKYALHDEFIVSINVFKNSDQNLKKYLSTFVKNHCYMPGDVILGLHDVGHEAFYIKSGSCVLNFEDGFTKAVKPKEIIGEDHLFVPSISNFELTATTCVIINSLDHQTISEVMISLSDFVLHTPQNMMLTVLEEVENHDIKQAQKKILAMSQNWLDLTETIETTAGQSRQIYKSLAWININNIEGYKKTKTAKGNVESEKALEIMAKSVAHEVMA